MGHEAYLRRERERGQESASTSEAPFTETITEADLQPADETHGVLVSNPAWRRYMRKEDTWDPNE